MCLELNAHALVSTIIYFRDNGIAESFLPWMFGSQACEKIFRAVRSLSSTYSTVVNFSMLELVHKINRINFQSEIINQLHGDFEFPREIKREKNANVADGNLKMIDLPSNEQMRETIKSAFEEAFDLTKSLSMRFESFSRRSFIEPRPKLSKIAVESSDEELIEPENNKTEPSESANSTDINLMTKRFNLFISTKMNLHKIFRQPDHLPIMNSMVKRLL